MNTFLLATIIIIDIGLMVFGILFFVRSFMRAARKDAPFIPAPMRVVRALTQHIQLDQRSVVYDLGCGDGRLLRQLHDISPYATYIGIERGLFPCLLFRVKHRRIYGKNFYIRRANFFTQNISDATHILTYLYPHVMDALLQKLEHELRPGTQLVSVDFPFSKKGPEQVIPLPVSKLCLGRKLYVYKF